MGFNYSLKEVRIFFLVYCKQQSFINVQHLYFSELMNVGSLIAIFLAVAVVLLSLLCLIMKCFSLRLAKQKQHVVDRYNDSTQVDWMQGSCCEGAYNQFCNHREHKRKTNLKNSLLEEDILMQQENNKKLLLLTDEIYTPSPLHRKLTSDIELPNVSTIRSLSHLNDIKFSRINTSREFKHFKQFNSYKFTKQLICYNRQGLYILQVIPLTVIKKKDDIFLQKTIHEHTVEPSQTNFQDLLQSYGYNLFQYGCSHLTCEIDMDQLKNGEIYELKNIETRQYKQEIDLEEYNNVKSTLQDEI